MSDTNLSITGRIVKVLEEQSGEGANGTWRKREFILETGGQYPKQIACVQWGDQIDRPEVVEGATVTAAIYIQSREYNGRWYTDVKAWRVDTEQVPTETPGEPQEWESAPAGADDPLPF